MEKETVESFEEQILEHEAMAVEVTIEGLVIEIQEDLYKCTRQSAVNVAKHVNCHLNQLVIRLFFAVIVLGTRHIQRDLVEGILKNLISKKNDSTRQYVLNVETNVKYHFDLLVENQFTVATVLERVTTLEARTLNSWKKSLKD